MTPAENLLAIAARFAALPDLPPGSPDAFTQRQAPALLSRLAAKIESPDPAIVAQGREQLLAIAASWRDRTSPGASLWAEACAAIGEAMPEPVAAPIERGAGQDSIVLMLAAAYERGRAKGREEASAEGEKLRARVADLEGDLRGVHGLHRDALAREGDKLTRIANLEAQLADAPSGLRVAVLLAAVDDEAKRSDDNARRLSPRSGEHAMFRDGLLKAARLTRAHLGEPTPVERAAAEVLALMAKVPGTLKADGGLYHKLTYWEDIHSDTSPPDPTREAFVDVAAMALAGILACDAKGGA